MVMKVLKLCVLSVSMFLVFGCFVLKLLCVLCIFDWEVSGVV